MQRIIIENFGPIQHLDLEIKDLSLFIGEQATGKSTVAKLIYFFKSLRGDLIDYLYEQRPVGVKRDLFRHFMYTRVNDKFNRMFYDRENKLTSSIIVFNYGGIKYLHYEATFDPTLPRFNFYDNESEKGNQTRAEFIKICQDIEDFRDRYSTKDIAFLNSSEYQEIEMDKLFELGEIKNRINAFFSDDGEMLFIPAGRTVFSSLPEHLQVTEKNDLDLLMSLFLRRVLRIKPVFKQFLAQLLVEATPNRKMLPSQEVLELSIQKISQILKAEYKISDSGEERIYFDNENYIPLSMASSGQQEALWILMNILIFLLTPEKVFLVIEEPEAHLAPKAQKLIIELITLLFRENKNQILITTHSPYILTAFNNLIYAGNVGKEHPKEVGKIIPPQLWIDSEQVGAYKLRGGTCEDLMDRETMLIRVEELDSVSKSINQAFDAILNLELQ